MNLKEWKLKQDAARGKKLDVTKLNAMEIAHCGLKLFAFEGVSDEEAEAAQRELSRRVEANVDDMIEECDPGWKERRKAFLERECNNRSDP